MADVLDVYKSVFVTSKSEITTYIFRLYVIYYIFSIWTLVKFRFPDYCVAACPQGQWVNLEGLRPCTRYRIMRMHLPMGLRNSFPSLLVFNVSSFLTPGCTAFCSVSSALGSEKCCCPPFEKSPVPRSLVTPNALVLPSVAINNKAKFNRICAMQTDYLLANEYPTLNLQDLDINKSKLWMTMKQIHDVSNYRKY